MPEYREVRTIDSRYSQYKLEDTAGSAIQRKKDNR